MRGLSWGLSAAAALALLACGAPPGDGLAHPELPARRAGASEAFWEAWGDGRAEMSGYRGVVSRYGELRPAELVQIYVTEPHDRRTWIKDDAVQGPDRVAVLKLNQSLRFQTGVYPYSVMTSVFAPVDSHFDERFQPVKISLTAQEWCGHVFAAAWPGPGELQLHTLSYFASEGEATERQAVPEGALYEDALLIQLRELDGPFHGGEDWEGALVPTLWRARRAHTPLRPSPATITRAPAERDGAPVTRFTVAQGDYRRTIDVERDAPRRVLGWSTSDGEEMQILATRRLPYWELNHNGDERVRAELGLDALAAPPPPGAAD